MTKLTWGFTGKPTTIENVVNCVGPGWAEIVRELIDDLLKLGWNGVVLQCKEKFGSLRFYIGVGNADMFDTIEKFLIKSSTICEVCGKPGRLYTDGWWKTLCPEHAVGRSNDDPLP